MDNGNEIAEDGNIVHSSDEVPAAEIEQTTTDPIQQLHTRVQSLKATIEKQKIENNHLKNLLSLQLDSDLQEQVPRKRLKCSNGETSSVVSVNDEEQEMRVPDVALQKILKGLNDQEALLGCRLVCRQWNHTITTNTGLMEQITFPIWHPRLFLDLQIAKEVKSIVFKLSFPSNSIHWAKFLDVISKTVRKAAFDYELDENSILNQQKNFSEVLGKCTELQELKIIGSNKELIKVCCENTIVAAANTIEIFSIKPSGLKTVEDCAGISEILYKLPRLTVLEMFMVQDDVVNQRILQATYDYLVMYPTVLKEIRIVDPDLSLNPNKACNVLLIKTALLASKNRTSLQCNSVIGLNSLLNLEEDQETDEFFANTMRSAIPINLPIKNGVLNFVGDKLKNLNRLEVCTKLEKLGLKFQRNLMQGELNSLRNLLPLKGLALVCSENFRLNWESIAQLDQQLFSTGNLPAVKELLIVGDVFGLPRFWSCYFPNLEELGLSGMKITPKDIFIILSTLEKLVELAFRDLTELEDEAFTTLCKNDTIEVPAIARFKMLTKLTILNCPKLTNKCIVDGISKITSLEELCIEDMPNLTQDVCNSYHFEVTYL